MVLHTQEAFRGQRQRSCVQARTYSSTGTRPWQLAKAAAVSSRSHSARWGAMQEAGMGGAAHAPIQINEYIANVMRNITMT